MVAVEVTGEEEDLVVLGLGLEKGTDLLPAGGIGVDQAVIEDDRIGFVAGDGPGYGKAQGQEELFLSALGKKGKRNHRLRRRADPEETEFFVYKDLSV